MRRLLTARYLAIVILILGVVSTSIGLEVRRHRQHSYRESTTPPFTMVSRQTFLTRSPADKGLLNAMKVRFQRSDGNWKEVTTYYKQDGAVLTISKEFGITSRGVFEVHDNTRTLLFLSPKRHSVHAMDEEEFRQSAEFRREDTVLGFNVLVQHMANADAESELAFAPALGGALLKVIDAGSAGFTVIEPLKIDLGEPSESEFADIPDYPFDYRFYEGQIKSEESRGHREVASRMREVLHQHQKMFARP